MTTIHHNLRLIKQRKQRLEDEKYRTQQEDWINEHSQIECKWGANCQYHQHPHHDGSNQPVELDSRMSRSPRNGNVQQADIQTITYDLEKVSLSPTVRRSSPRNRGEAKSNGRRPGTVEVVLPADGPLGLE